MRKKVKKIAFKKQAKLTKIINANLNKFRIFKVLYVALRHIIKIPNQAALRV